MAVRTSPTDTQGGNTPVDRRHSACNSTDRRTPVEMHSTTGGTTVVFVPVLKR